MMDYLLTGMPYRFWPWQRPWSIVYLPVGLTDKGRVRWFIYCWPNWQRLRLILYLPVGKGCDRVICDGRQDVVDDGRWGNRSKSSEGLHWSFFTDRYPVRQHTHGYDSRDSRQIILRCLFLLTAKSTIRNFHETQNYRKSANSTNPRADYFIDRMC